MADTVYIRHADEFDSEDEVHAPLLRQKGPSGKSEHIYLIERKRCGPSSSV